MYATGMLSVLNRALPPDPGEKELLCTFLCHRISQYPDAAGTTDNLTLCSWGGQAGRGLPAQGSMAGTEEAGHPGLHQTWGC